MACGDEFDEEEEVGEPTVMVGQKDAVETGSREKEEEEEEAVDLLSAQQAAQRPRNSRDQTSGGVFAEQPGEGGSVLDVGTRWRYGGLRSSTSGPTHAMTSAVYMVEAGLANYSVAMGTSEAEQWQVAVDSECSSIVKNKVLTFVDSIPSGKKAIPTRLILQRKLGPRGETTRYKARLVAQGFRQIEGLDFAETFAPVASLSSVRILLAIAGSRGYTVIQMDVVTTFLGSKLDEEVYLRLPRGVLGGPRLARLNRSLYGLKQSPRCWYTTIDNFLVKQLGFKRGRFDCCIYTHTNGTILALYVDDLLIAGEENFISNIRKRLQQRFDMLDLGLVENFLGIVVTRDLRAHKIYITQAQEGYIGRILEKFRMLDCKPIAVKIFAKVPYLQLNYDAGRLDEET